jgi:hypothetical protein
LKPEVQHGVVIDLRRGFTALAQKLASRIRGGEQAWNAGLGEVVKAAIHESDLPPTMTPVQLARQLGILRPERRQRGPR